MAASTLVPTAAEQLQKGTEASEARKAELTYKRQSVKEEKDNMSGFGSRKTAGTDILEINVGGECRVTGCGSLAQNRGQIIIGGASTQGSKLLCVTRVPTGVAWMAAP